MLHQMPPMEDPRACAQHNDTRSPATESSRGLSSVQWRMRIAGLVLLRIERDQTSLT